jgi:predicted RNA-binding protein YlxR (DUF448 family)
VRTPEGRFLLDPDGKAAGRGAYLCAARDCIDAALRRKGFDRAFRQAVPREAVAALETELTDHLRSRARVEAEDETLARLP